MRVYVAGPYTKGDTAENVGLALIVAEELLARGHTPFVPHLTHFWHFKFPHPAKFWYEYDLLWLEQCQGLLRFPGESVGADREVERAKQLGLPVWFDILDVPGADSDGTDFCRYCGAGKPPMYGEGTCRRCDPGGVKGYQGGRVA